MKLPQPTLLDWAIGAVSPAWGKSRYQDWV